MHSSLRNTVRAAALALLLALPSAAAAQELSPGDYRLEGRDPDGRAVTVTLHVTESGGSVRIERSEVKPERSDALAKAKTYTSLSAAVDPDDTDEALIVTYAKRGRGLCSALEALDPDPDEDLTARYVVSSDGERVYEYVNDAGDVTVSRGGKDHPTLELVREARLVELVGDKLNRYEASGVKSVGDHLYVVLDNSTRVAVVDRELSAGDLVKTGGSGASNYEGLTYDAASETFYAMIEYARRGSRWYGRVVELDDELEEQDEHRLRGYRLPGHNKGFEGVAHVRRDGQEFLLGLLEGNNGDHDADALERGQGRIVVFRRKADGRWSDDAMVRLPETALFTDYSGIDVDDAGNVVVVSQTTSMVWIGKLSPNAWEFDGEGSVYRFPRQGTRLIYGAVEGISWIDGKTLAAVSDIAEGCEETAESVHVFRLP